jgi:methionyl-tRNA formyltransferase
MKIVFAGTNDVALLPLLELKTTHDVIKVLTRKDAIAGRGHKLQKSPVKVLAEELGLPVFETEPADSEFLHELQATNAKLGVVVSYGKILKQPVLDALKHGWINLHFSLLPKYRGAAPVQWAIMNGETETGVTVFRLEAGLDSGPIFVQTRVELSQNSTSGDVLDELSAIGATLLVNTVTAIENGTATETPQPNIADEQAIYAGKITNAVAKIDWNCDAEHICNKVRALNPSPLAFGTLKNGKKSQKVLFYEVAPANLPETAQNLAIGELFLTKKSAFVKTATAGGYDSVQLITVKPENKRQMNAMDWLRGVNLDSDASFT